MKQTTPSANETARRKSHTPEIRFAGFTEDWELSRLDALIEGERLKLAKLKQLRAAFLQRMFV